MKTTAGKTKVHRAEARPIRIYVTGGRDLIAVKKASSLKQALEEYWKDTLQPKGYTGKKVNGNVLVCNLKGQICTYRALEVYQAP